MTQQEIDNKKREDELARLAEEEPEFGHDGAKMDSDERPRSEAERKPGNSPGENADSHAEAHAASKGDKP
jgi:hypothetical protein